MERITAIAGCALLAVFALSIAACATQRVSDQRPGINASQHHQSSRTFGNQKLPPPELCLAGTQGCLAAYPEPPHLCPAAGPMQHCPNDGGLMRADLASR
jgi:hypothetical protein